MGPGLFMNSVGSDQVDEGFEMAGESGNHFINDNKRKDISVTLSPSIVQV